MVVLEDVETAPLSPMVMVTSTSPALGHIPESTTETLLDSEDATFRSERTYAFDSMASASSMTSGSSMGSQCFQCTILRERLAQANQQHDQMPLLFADLVSKHNDLIDDHEKLREDPDWRCSEELQQALVALHANNPHHFRVEVVTMVRSHPSMFDILEAAKIEDIAPDYLYPFHEFAAYFTEKEGSIHNEQLLRLMFDDMQKYDDRHVKLETVHQWMSTIPEQKSEDDAVHVDAVQKDNDDAKSGDGDGDGGARDRKMNVLKLKVEVLELEKADLDFKLNEKQQELDKVVESAMARYEEMERKYNALLEKMDEDDDDAPDERGSDRAGDRRRRGRRMKKQLQDEESGTCSMWPTFKDY